MIRLYCGVNEKQWNHDPVQPGPYACISPVRGKPGKKRTNPVLTPIETEIIQDSGAFSDSPEERLSFSESLKRQEKHAKSQGYLEQVTHVASYDLLIDEMWLDGERQKNRWPEQRAWQAVQETNEAARYLRQQKDTDHPYLKNKGLVLSAQGVTPDQYLECTKQIIPLLKPGDIFGLGGWCISGMMPKKMMPCFAETMNRVIPYAAENGAKWVHIWGVIDPFFLGPLLWLCDQYNLFLSTDSAGPQTRPAISGQWGWREWKDKAFEKPPMADMGKLRALHVELTREYLANIANTRHYKKPASVCKLDLKHNNVQFGLF